MPKFCSQCLSQGHVALACPWGQRETLPIQADPRPELGPGRLPAVRRNASKRSSSKSHTNSTSASFVSSSSPHPHTSTATITQSIPPISTVSTQAVVELRPSDSSQLTPSVCQYAPSHLSACSSGGNASKMSPNPSEGLVHQQQPHPQIDRQSDTGPNPVATISPQPSTNGCMNQSVSADTQQELQLMPTQGALCPTRAPVPVEDGHPAMIKDLLVQHPTLAEPQLIPPTKSKSKTRNIRPKKKSVSFKLPGETNLSANVDFWSAVNNKITDIEQNHTNIANQSIPLSPSAVPIVDDSHPPSMHPNNPNFSTSVPPSTCPSDKQKCKIATFVTGKVHPQPNVAANTVLWEAVNRQVSILDQARLTGSPAVQSHHSSSRATVPNPPVSIPSSSNTNLSTMSPSTSDSESSFAADSPPYSPTQIPHGSQNDIFSMKPTSYKSEGEDSGTEEARFQGHFSDDMSSAKPKSSRKNKRHPDQPLNVQLRVRKGGGY